MHPTLRARADRQLGLFTTADALDAGYGHTEIQRIVGRARWVRLRRGVYVTAEDLAEHERTGRRHRVECLAVLLALGRPSAAISHASAARLWKIPVRADLLGPIRVTDPGPWRRGAGYLLTEAPLPLRHAITVGPLRLTAVARTLVDCAREWPLEPAVVAMDAALLAGGTTPEELRQCLASARRWPGAASAARAVDLADGRAESALETRGRLRMLGAALSAPSLQVEIRAGSGLVAVVDAWFDDAAVAVEFDGKVKYTDPWRGRTPERVLWDEKLREDELRALDIKVLRITHRDLGPRWWRTEARLWELLRRPGPTVRRFAAVPRDRGRLRTG